MKEANQDQDQGQGTAQQTTPGVVSADGAAPEGGNRVISPDQPLPADFDILRDIDWETPPPAERIAEWKTRPEVGQDGVRVATYPGGLDIYFRLLTRVEYKTIIYGPWPLDQRENEICQRCVLWPEGIDFHRMFAPGKPLYGIPSMLVENILDHSGFVPALEIKKV